MLSNHARVYNMVAPFCIALHDLINTVKSEFSAFYLDNGIIGGSSKDVSYYI